MHRHLLNGFTNTLFRPTGPDRWIVSGATGRGPARLLPSREAGVAIRRRAIWGWAVTCAAALGASLWDVAPSAPPAILILGLVIIWSGSRSAIDALPVSDEHLTWRERLYQFRGVIALVAAILSGSALTFLWVGSKLEESVSLLLGSATLALGALMVMLVVYASRCGHPPTADSARTSAAAPTTH